MQNARGVRDAVELLRGRCKNTMGRTSRQPQFCLTASSRAT